MKYRKKPVVIEAFKWTGDEFQTEDPIWIEKAVAKKDIWFSDFGTPQVTIKIGTLEGVMEAQRGDYIIQGVKGEIYPCKPDIFELTYEKAELETEKVVKATLDVVNHINKNKNFAKPLSNY